MKAEVRYYEKGFSSEAPEIKELREEAEVASKDELVEAAKAVEIPASAEYANIYVDEEPVIGIGHGCVRDIETDEWIIEMRRKTPSFRAGDIRRVRRICVSN